MTIFLFLPLLCSLLFSSIEGANGTMPSVHTPALITETTTIELTEDIVIDSRGTPFIASPHLGKKQAEKLVITSTSKKAVIITPRGYWDLSSFNKSTTSIEFRGNARLVLQPGAHLHGFNTKLVFAEQSRCE